jgi:drug/metabolite transporter (DMT)-like permease
MGQRKLDLERKSSRSDQHHFGKVGALRRWVREAWSVQSDEILGSKGANYTSVCSDFHQKCLNITWRTSLCGSSPQASPHIVQALRAESSLTAMMRFADMKEYAEECCEIPIVKKFLPLFLVFLSGLGFSIQSLTIKKLQENSGYSASFQLIFFRGLTQLIMSLGFIYYHEDPNARRYPFGETSFVKKALFVRSCVGYGGIAFAFLGIENLPLGDATVLVMLSPLFASMFSYLILGESFGKAELLALSISLTGVVLISRPSFIFGGGQALPLIGVVYALVASVCAGGAYTSIRLLGTVAKMPWANVCLAQAFGQIILSLPSSVLFHQHLQWSTLTATEWAGILGAGFLGAWSQIAMTVGMQKEKSATATGMRMSDVFFGFIWQVSFTQDNTLNLLSVCGACLVVSSIFLLVFSKGGSKAASTAKDGEGGRGDVGADIELGGTPNGYKKAGSEVYSALRSEMSDSEHLAGTRVDVSEHMPRSHYTIDDEGDEASALDLVATPGRSVDGKENRQGDSNVSRSPDDVDLAFGGGGATFEQTYKQLQAQFGRPGDSDNEGEFEDEGPSGAIGEDVGAWELDIDALKDEFDI